VKLSPEDEYERRLRGRQTDSEAVIQRRLENARNELLFADSYRYQVVNADLEQAVNEIIEIIRSWEAQCSKS